MQIQGLHRRSFKKYAELNGLVIYNERDSEHKTGIQKT